jgi:hypothetical protein
MPRKSAATKITTVVQQSETIAEPVAFSPPPAQIVLEATDNEPTKSETKTTKEKQPKKTKNTKNTENTENTETKDTKEKEPKTKATKTTKVKGLKELSQVVPDKSEDVAIKDAIAINDKEDPITISTIINNEPVENVQPKGRKPSKKAQKTEPTTPVRVLEPVLKEVHNVTMQACELDGSECDKEVDLTACQEVIAGPLDTELETNKHIAKKRGRKPKGGKITQQSSVCNIIKTPKPNIILHLKCFMKDLQESNVLSDNQVVSFNFSTNKNDLSFDTINSMNEVISSNYANNEIADINPNMNDEEEDANDEDNYTNDPVTLCSVISSKSAVAFKKNEQKDLWKKLKQLAHNLHVNNISDKKSCCFWDTYEFDNPPVHIPKHYMKDAYQVYGCFCSPECAVAYLMAENIDISVKFERYHLLNFIYGKIYNYERNVKPAPTPHYLLNRFDGNMNIQEYRSLLKKERLYLVVDKPLTRILPELHEDNDDFILNNKIIPSNNFQVNKKIQKNNPTKNIISEQFGLGAM